MKRRPEATDRSKAERVNALLWHLGMDAISLDQFWWMMKQSGLTSEDIDRYKDHWFNARRGLPAHTAAA